MFGMYKRFSFSEYSSNCPFSKDFNDGQCEYITAHDFPSRCILRIILFDIRSILNFCNLSHAEYPDMRIEKAAKALVKIGKPAIDELSHILNENDNATTKDNVQYILKKIG